MTHERALLDDLMGRIDSLARAEGAERVVRISVRLGALSHFTPEHFREHFEWAAQGTIAEGATVEAEIDPELGGEAAQGVLLEDVELAVGDPGVSG